VLPRSDWTSIGPALASSGSVVVAPVSITGGAQTDSAMTPAASTISATTEPARYPGLVRSGSWNSSMPSAMLASGSMMSMAAWELASGPAAYAACRRTMPKTPVAIMA
jgi:hypothetical protein